MRRQVKGLKQRPIIGNEKVEECRSPGFRSWKTAFFPGSSLEVLVLALPGVCLPISGPVSLQLRGILAWMEVGAIDPLLFLGNDPENLWVT